MNISKKNRFLAIFLSILIVMVNLPFGVMTAKGAGGTSGKLLNGSFEEPEFSGTYKQFDKSAVPYWNTTAYNTNGINGMIELFRQNTGTYVSGATLKPSDGKQGAELNADEESTLYQVVNTEPSSLYEWGLDHGARTASDTMALIIGPNQSVSPSKNWGEGYESSDLSSQNPTLRTGYKYGKDQMMQMVEWLKATGKIGSVTENVGLANDGKAIILYSKKFAENGSFEDNQDNQPFSMEPSSVYTEKWHIWIMTDHKAGTGITENPWTHYGLNAEAGSSLSGGGGGVDLSKYYLYSVPSGQLQTIFAFTSVENMPTNSTGIANPTYGNFLDGVNFRLYHSLTGSTTPNGSAVVGSSDGSLGGEGSSTGHAITVDNNVSTYVPDGQPLRIHAKVTAGDVNNVTFAGVYYTAQTSSGSGQTQFIKVKDNPEWTKDIDESRNIIYTYSLPNVTSAVDLHFVFIKSPLITYDVNGGKPYLCTPSGSNNPLEPDNVYSFKPSTDDNGVVYVNPYKSHEPEGQTDDWKFMGWQLFDDNGAGVLLSATHSIACNYRQSSGGESVLTTQNFVVIENDDSFGEPTITTGGANWPTSAEKKYDDNAIGLSLVAQWRWRQTFIPQTNSGTGYTESDAGGSVAVTSISVPNENYDDSYNGNGAKAYFAGTNETVIATATAREGYYFDGWYDKNGNQITASTELKFVERKEDINSYYARFSKKLSQRYIRQIKINGIWEDLGDGDDYERKVPLLDHTSYNEGVGTVVSSTASNSSYYALVGWYDEAGNRVPDSMICNDGKTIRYAITRDAKYYARYEQFLTTNFKMQLVNKDGTLTDLADDNNYASLSSNSANAVSGQKVKSKAYPKVGYEFVGWYDEADNNANKITADIDTTDEKVINPVVTTDGKTYYARFKARTDVKYTVNHYKVNADGTGATLVTSDIENLRGTTDTTVNATAKSYAGYTYAASFDQNSMKTVSSGTVAGDGSLVLKLYYTPNTSTKYTVKHHKVNAAGTSSSVADSEEKAGTTDCTVNASSKEYVGYTYKASYDHNGMKTISSGKVVGDGSLVLNLYYVPDTDTTYTVNHYKVNADGTGATLVTSDVENLTGTTDTTVNATAKSYAGYTYAATFDQNSMKTVSSGTVAGDGS
ncbi:MAG: hypothetical protein PUE18_01740, partial [Firmicutes bacterium]|nr:hypothetical protein [Bacillota bacterium]